MSTGNVESAMTDAGSNPAPSVEDSDAAARCESCGQPPALKVKRNSDGRLPGEWEHRYTGSAKRRIRCEAIYILISFAVYLVGIAVVSYSAQHPVWFARPEVMKPYAPQILAYLGGSFGGTLFDMKWLYHSVAKHEWNADRRFWRYFTPLLSGGGALCVILLSTSQVLPLFGSDVARTASGALGISIVLGYFSDRVFSALEGFARQSMPGSKPADSSQTSAAPNSQA